MAEERHEETVRTKTVPIDERPARRPDEDMVRDETTRVTYAAPVTERTDLSIDRLRWGPVVGGIIGTIATLVVLDVLGVALGFSVVSPSGATIPDLRNGPGIWSAVAGVVAFFIGGWVAGRTVAPAMGSPSRFPGMINGVMVWATTLFVLLILVGIGAGNALGYFGASFLAIANGVLGTPTGGTLNAALQGAWGTFIALVLTLILALLGGWAGYASQPLRRRFVSH